MRVLRFILLLVAVATAVPALAQTFPPLTGRVVDTADLLTPEQEQQLTARLVALERASSRQLVVATIPSLQGYEIEEYGYRLGRAWHIGQTQANNGTILLVAPTERKVRIEVGYGLEPILTDALSHQIIAETILPRFRENNMGAGIVAGTDAVIQQLGAPPEQAEQRALAAAERERRQSSSGGGGSPIGLIFWVIVIAFVVLPMILRRRRGRRYGTRGRRRGWGAAPVILWGGGGWGGGGGGWGSGGGGWGGGGGGFSGGGGSFGGGGASGSW